MVTHKITGIELGKLLPHSPCSFRSELEDDTSGLIPTFISDRFAGYNFLDAMVYDEIFNFPNNMSE